MSDIKVINTDDMANRYIAMSDLIELIDDLTNFEPDDTAITANSSVTTFDEFNHLVDDYRKIRGVMPALKLISRDVRTSIFELPDDVVNADDINN